MNTLSHLYVTTGRAVDAKSTAGEAYKADPYLTDANKTVWRLFQLSHDLEFGVEAKKPCDEEALLPDRLPIRRVPVVASHGPGSDAASQGRRDLEGLRRATWRPTRWTSRKSRSGRECCWPESRYACEPPRQRTRRDRPGRGEREPRSEWGPGLPGGHGPQSARGEGQGYLVAQPLLCCAPATESVCGPRRSFWWKPLQEDPKYRALVGPAK